MVVLFDQETGWAVGTPRSSPIGFRASAPGELRIMRQQSLCAGAHEHHLGEVRGLRAEMVVDSTQEAINVRRPASSWPRDRPQRCEGAVRQSHQMRSYPVRTLHMHGAPPADDTPRAKHPSHRSISLARRAGNHTYDTGEGLGTLNVYAGFPAQPWDSRGRGCMYIYSRDKRSFI